MHRHKGRIRLLLVEDHEIVRVALRVLLERTGDIEVVGEAGTAALALMQVLTHKPDLVLLDVKLPDGSGIELCRDIRAAHPETHVLFLTALPDTEILLSCVKGWADGYLHKTIGLEPLVEGIKTVISGKPYFDHAAASSAMSRLEPPSLCTEANLLLQLAPQERRVVALIADGKTNKEIGEALSLSDKTVKNYISNAFQKLRISRRTQAAALFAKTFSSTPTVPG